jgi:hypothetical protein
VVCFGERKRDLYNENIHPSCATKTAMAMKRSMVAVPIKWYDRGMELSRETEFFIKKML